uniref:SHSP domain-containing protein n=1 Tax=Nothobranchius furzeri TaxID=105023 RepID=A0A8C6MA30_NOTFU
MTEPARTEKPCEEHNTAPTQGKWWQFSQILNPDVGLPRVLEPGERRWMEVDWFRRNLAAFSWLGSIPAPLSGPYVSESMLHPGQKISKWRVSMDVAHFHPSEISLSLRDGFLEVAGTHEERPDEHGFIARCFKRKYRWERNIRSNSSLLSLLLLFFKASSRGGRDQTHVQTFCRRNPDHRSSSSGILCSCRHHSSNKGEQVRLTCRLKSVLGTAGLD